MSGICWGPLWQRACRRCSIDGAIWDSVGDCSKRGKKADGDGKAKAEYGATHVEDDDDKVQNETEVYNGSESVKVKEVSKYRTSIRTVSKTEKVLYTNEPGVPGIQWGNDTCCRLIAQTVQQQPGGRSGICMVNEYQ